MNDTLQLTEKQIDELADAHIERYEGMIGCGHPAVRVDECRNYLRIWRSIKEKNKNKGDFNTAEDVDFAFVSTALTAGGGISCGGRWASILARRRVRPNAVVHVSLQ